jgi:hypothetical protein
LVHEEKYTRGFSHAKSFKPGSNLGEPALTVDRLESNFSPFSPCIPQREPVTRRIPEGQIFGTIPLEAAKAYPTRIFNGLPVKPRIAYADWNTHREQNLLSIKFLPGGAKTAPHPQIVFFVNGSYHVEQLGYMKTNPLTWSTWMEFHIEGNQLKHVIDAVIKAELALEAL